MGKAMSPENAPDIRAVQPGEATGHRPPGKPHATNCVDIE